MGPPFGGPPGVGVGNGMSRTPPGVRRTARLLERAAEDLHPTSAPPDCPTLEHSSVP